MERGRLLSRITPEAVTELSLAPGKNVWAVAKTSPL
jgi:molybdopterin-binding protein